MEISFIEKVNGGIVGLLVGDALGVPYEFHPPEAIPTLAEIEFEPPNYFQRAHAGVPVGTWSDDGAQALCLLASLLECDEFNAVDFATKLVSWYRDDYLAVDQIFDVGNQTLRAILNLRKGIPPLEAGPQDESKNGNGSLMRVLPLAIWHQGSDKDLVRDAMLQSKVTHGHLRSQLCCALYCLWARRILQNIEDPWESAVETFEKIFREGTIQRIEFKTQIILNNEVKGSGYVVDSLHSARWACTHPTYEETVKAAISLGNDTDTTACIAGGIAGLKFGLSGIPQRWRENLRGREIYQLLLEKLIDKF